MTLPSVRRSPWTVEIPATARAGMRVPAVVFADEVLWSQVTGDRTLDQLMNVATLPGVADFVCAMPDAHEGYGFPVGGVAAFDPAQGGVISPGGVGYDINCGVRLLASTLTLREIGARLEPLVHDLSRAIPSGTGRGGELELGDAELDAVLARGAGWLHQQGWATGDDLEATEGHGALPGADPAAVSARARARGHGQLGTIGSGNHFVEVQEVAEVLDADAAGAMGLAAGRCTVLIHTGSRGLGHQVCTDYVRTMDAAMVRAGITLPDRQLACAPFDSPEGARYFGAMNAAANFAFANRQLIAHRVRTAFTRAFGDAGTLAQVYDVAHNIAKVEDHGGRRLLVHRKGATRSFGPGHPETPARYRGAGQPVLIPGSMGTASFVLAGTDAALGLSFGSCCHGAGRVMSRGAAKRVRPGHEVRRALEAQGIVVRCPRSQELAEEAPHAYKDVERVVEVVAGAGLARPVVRLVPRGVIKG